MQTLGFWTRAVIVDAAFVVCILAGALLGVDFLLNVGLFLGWAMAALLVVSALFWGEIVKKMDPDLPKWRIYRTRLWKIYDFATDATFILVLSGLEYFALAGLMLLGKLLVKTQLYTWIGEQQTEAAHG